MWLLLNTLPCAAAWGKAKKAGFVSSWVKISLIDKIHYQSFVGAAANKPMKIGNANCGPWDVN